ncbi:MAG TPA: glycosyltransferase family 2 protein [Thermodesulfobacteriota bacterium]|nr:glycosyltransferase family 2 protein [Thermodesulfobacteriota bacterium]
MYKSELKEVESPVYSGNLPLASIIITSYNYEKLLPRAIDSALQQTYPKKEIIVVDDGSTDNSRQIITSYGNQIIPVFKKNEGRVSATNAGFFASHGEIIFFLDADDIFFPHKVGTMVNYFLQVMPLTPEALIFHCMEMCTDDANSPSHSIPRSLRTIDGKKKNSLFAKLSDPEIAYQYVQKWGFLPFRASPTSGLLLTRLLAGKIFPLPGKKAASQDACIVYASTIVGTVYGTSQVLGSYFIHEKNLSMSQSYSDNKIQHYQIVDNFLNDILAKMNKKRVISFYESRLARPHYQHIGSTKGLLRLSWKIPARYFCWETIWFSIKTLWLCLKVVLGFKKKRRLANKTKLFAKAKETQRK